MQVNKVEMSQTTVGVPWNGIWDTVEGGSLLFSRKFEAVMNTVKLVFVLRIDLERISVAFLRISSSNAASSFRIALDMTEIA